MLGNLLFGPFEPGIAILKILGNHVANWPIVWVLGEELEFWFFANLVWKLLNTPEAQS